MQRVFVYGTLLSGQANHHLLRSAKLLGQGKTAQPYNMWDLGRGYPGVTFPKEGQDSGTSAGYPIIGEMYEVDEGGFTQLDALEGYEEGGGGLYDRHNARVLLSEGGEKEAWMYTYNGPVEGREQIKSGSWKSVSPDGNIKKFNTPDYEGRDGAK